MSARQLKHIPCEASSQRESLQKPELEHVEMLNDTWWIQLIFGDKVIFEGVYLAYLSLGERQNGKPQWCNSGLLSTLLKACQIEGGVVMKIDST